MIGWVKTTTTVSTVSVDRKTKPRESARIEQEDQVQAQLDTYNPLLKIKWDRELAASDWASTTTEEGGVRTYERSGELGESFVVRAEESEIEDPAFDEEEEDDDDSETDDEQDEGGSHEQGQKRKRDSKMDGEQDEDGPQGQGQERRRNSDESEE